MSRYNAVVRAELAPSKRVCHEERAPHQRRQHLSTAEARQLCSDEFTVNRVQTPE